MKKETIMKLIEAFYSAGYELISFANISFDYYPAAIEFKLAYDEKNIIKLAEILNTMGFEIVQFDKTAMETTIALAPIWTKRKD